MKMTVNDHAKGIAPKRKIELFAIIAAKQKKAGA
jgi:hypothetical protein